MADVNRVFGFELFQKLYHDEIQKKEDVIILLVHWYLVKSGFRCIGIGNETVSDPLEKGSELLPMEWNLRPNYALRYVMDKKIHVLLGVKSDMDLLLNFMRTHNNSVCNIQLPIEETVSVLHGPLEIVIPSYQTILHSIQKEFVKPTCFNEAETQTSLSPINALAITTERDDNHQSLRTSRRPTVNRPEYDPARVGVRDLDPFREGGGMIYDPFDRRFPTEYPPGGLGVPGVLPAGAIPPGARFDPFGPPELDLHRRGPLRRPDHDHLPPPGYDDMFQ
ncbi:proteasome inhibitor PI31 subunit [Solenopsis invicta]|nr:proteasome inhibitor PI31 subunit [Solenopsis invicta]XP_011170590.1 proteasome inhibitor PI31 subunit [Solenopsis invicta]XP_011170591.1 proteasome inhibitor PI31 subunit [Solenopsis invicta]XP_025996360.1 proteasome inhibitor PI31 subunit [Solenopsis invicta]